MIQNLKNSLEKIKPGGEDETDIAPKIFGFAALGVMAAMFALMGFSMSIIIFLVLIGYFVWRVVSRSEIGEIRGVFEFYLSANEILRDDERRWYGFEIQEVIKRGNRILQLMPDAPPLVHFALGALNHRAGNFQEAENHLRYVLENDNSDERSRVTASAELRSYVRILRKLEREPAEAPQTTASIRALERARRHRAAAMLTESRQKIQVALELNAAKPAEIPQQVKSEPVRPLLERLEERAVDKNQAAPEQADELESVKPMTSIKTILNDSVVQSFAENAPDSPAKKTPAKTAAQKSSPEPDNAQKSITEVLRDIYD